MGYGNYIVRNTAQGQCDIQGERRRQLNRATEKGQTKLGEAAAMVGEQLEQGLKAFSVFLFYHDSLPHHRW